MKLRIVGVPEQKSENLFDSYHNSIMIYLVEINGAYRVKNKNYKNRISANNKTQSVIPIMIKFKSPKKCFTC